ncbi:MAG: hypothetical protein ACREEM_41750 [Blastocatellia bacterium]
MNAARNWFLAEAGRGAAFLFEWSWQALLLLACVWLGLKAFRAQSPAIRCQVWLFGLLAVVTVYFEADGQESTMQYRYTVNFIKWDGQLKITAIHMSLKS